MPNGYRDTVDILEEIATKNFVVSFKRDLKQQIGVFYRIFASALFCEIF